MSRDERDYSEYEFDSGVTEHLGFTIGDQIVCTADGHDEAYYEGDTGTVVGFSMIPPADNPELARAFGNDPKGRTAIYVVMDGTDEPIEVKPEHMDVE